MIIIEYTWGAMKAIAYYIARFIIWIVTARDCKHCKNRRYDLCELYCELGFSNSKKCKNTPHRCYFEREKR